MDILRASAPPREPIAAFRLMRCLPSGIRHQPTRDRQQSGYHHQRDQPEHEQRRAMFAGGVRHFQGDAAGERAYRIHDAGGHLHDISSDQQHRHGFTQRARNTQHTTRQQATAQMRSRCGQQATESR